MLRAARSPLGLGHVAEDVASRPDRPTSHTFLLRGSLSPPALIHLHRSDLRVPRASSPGALLCAT